MGEKKIKGRKRHIVTDILGNLLHVKVHAANIHDTKAAPNVLEETVYKHPEIKGFSADEGYKGTAVNFVEQKLQLKMEISKKIKDCWAVLAKRWIVERTLSWINNFRRMAKDFEILTLSEENFIRVAMMKIMLAKIC